jgi:hypothetical protein
MSTTQPPVFDVCSDALLVLPGVVFRILALTRRFATDSMGLNVLTSAKLLGSCLGPTWLKSARRRTSARLNLDRRYNFLTGLFGAPLIAAEPLDWCDRSLHRQRAGLRSDRRRALHATGPS